MYSRSELRHACYRAKNGVATEANKKVLELIEPLLKPGQRWDNFSIIWDLLLTRTNEIVIIKPETDRDFIHSTCLTASIYAKKKMKFDFDDREANIITMVEATMLEGLMDWTGYGFRWGIEVDKELKVVRTKLFNISSNQIDVTDDMIRASIKDDPVDVHEPAPPIETVLDAKTISKEDAEKIVSLHTKGRSRKA